MANTQTGTVAEVQISTITLPEYNFEEVIERLNSSWLVEIPTKSAASEACGGTGRTCNTSNNDGSCSKCGWTNG